MKTQNYEELSRKYNRLDNIQSGSKAMEQYISENGDIDEQTLSTLQNECEGVRGGSELCERADAKPYDGKPFAVGYIRVSTDGQAGEDKYGIEAQKESIQKYCEEHDMMLVNFYIDEGKSGAKEDRPELDKILFSDEVQNPPITACIVAKSDRIARDINIYFYYQHELLKKGIKLVSVMENFGEMGQFANIIKAFVITMAEMERENILKRTTAGKRVKAAQGGYSGGAIPFGYRKGYERGTWAVDERNAKLVRDVFKLNEAGASAEKISQYLNDMGAKTQRGGKFTQWAVYRILEHKKTYEGFYRYGDSDWVIGQHEPILAKR